MTRPRTETLVVFGIAVVGSIGIRAAPGGGGSPPPLGQPAAVGVSQRAGADASAAPQVQPARRPRLEAASARPDRPAATRAKHPRRSGQRRPATRRKAARR
jgi:hypothetical protein